MRRIDVRRLEKLEEAHKRDNPPEPVRLWWTWTEEGPNGEIIHKKERVA